MAKGKRRTRLENLLKSRKITAYKLAQALGYKDETRTTVYKWIYGISEPNAATMLKLTEILEVSAQEILEIFAEDRGQV